MQVSFSHQTHYTKVRIDTLSAVSSISAMHLFPYFSILILYISICREILWPWTRYSWESCMIIMVICSQIRGYYLSIIENDKLLLSCIIYKVQYELLPIASELLNAFLSFISIEENEITKCFKRFQKIIKSCTQEIRKRCVSLPVHGYFWISFWNIGNRCFFFREGKIYFI